MRFEHLIEINAPQSAMPSLVSTFTREQLWHGLMLRVQSPQRFPLGPERCDWQQAAPDLIQRTLHFGQHVLRDEVRLTALDQLVFTPEAHGDMAPIRLTVRIEEPHAGRMVLRFVYEALAEQTAEEVYFNSYRHNAWVMSDRDMVCTLRDWLDLGELGGITTN